MGWIRPKNTILTFKRRTFNFATKGQLESFEGTGTGFEVTPLTAGTTGQGEAGDSEETPDEGTADESEVKTCSAGFLFIRAVDMREGLNPWDIIPCVDVKITDPASPQAQNQDQTITFNASVHERESGWYHLIGWSCPEESDGAWVNHATVYEFALRIRSRDPNDPSN